MDASWETGPVGPWVAPEVPRVERAYLADCVVECVRGRWVVWLEVLLDSGPVRRKVAVEHDERRALQSARIIERNARRRIPAPLPPSRLPPPPPLTLTAHRDERIRPR